MRAKDSEEWWWIEFWLMIVNFAKLSPFIVPDLQSSLGLEINKVTSIIPRMLLVIESYVQIRRNVRELIYRKMKSTLIWLYKFNSNSINHERIPIWLHPYGVPHDLKGLRRPSVWRRIEAMKVKLAYCHSKLHAFVAVEFEIYSSLVSSFEQCMKFL